MNKYVKFIQKQCGGHQIINEFFDESLPGTIYSNGVYKYEEDVELIVDLAAVIYRFNSLPFAIELSLQTSSPILKCCVLNKETGSELGSFTWDLVDGGLFVDQTERRQKAICKLLGFKE